MNYPFSQPNIIYQVSFCIVFKDMDLYEEFFCAESIDDLLGVSLNEVKSETIESMPNDLWQMDVLFAKRPDSQLESKLAKYAQDHMSSFSDWSVKEIEDRDWVKHYQSQLKPILIGDFFITSNVSERVPEGKTPIYIEASRAFGTGDHATTSLCIEAISSFASDNIQSVFDLGTGSGILSFTAEKIWPKACVVACDIDPVAVEMAQVNAGHNGSGVSFYQNSEASIDLPPKAQKFDLVISNILASPLIEMVEQIKQITAKSGKVILSGFLDYQLQNVQESYHACGFKTLNILQSSRWCCLVLAPVE